MTAPAGRLSEEELARIASGKLYMDDIRRLLAEIAALQADLEIAELNFATQAEEFYRVKADLEAAQRDTRLSTKAIIDWISTAERMRLRAEAAERRLETVERETHDWVEVLASCLPDEEGYDEDTAAVLNNIIASAERVRAALAGDANSE